MVSLLQTGRKEAEKEKRKEEKVERAEELEKPEERDKRRKRKKERGMMGLGKDDRKEQVKVKENSNVDNDCKVKKVRGDGLLVNVELNEKVLQVTGDGCRVCIAKNNGTLRIVGDGCRVNVKHNAGEIQYEGDGGRVTLGPESSREKVKYIGQGGKVTLETLQDQRKKLEKREENPFSAFRKDFTRETSHKRHVEFQGNGANNRQGQSIFRKEPKTLESRFNAKNKFYHEITTITHATKKTMTTTATTQ